MSDKNLQNYTDYFEQLSIASLDQLDRVMTEDVHFVDPFNDVRGLESVRKIFVHMFSNLDDAKFTVTYAAVTGGAEQHGLLRWELSALLKGKPYTIVGMSDVVFDADGRVKEHIDHWDAAGQFYERLPFIGWLLRTIRARLAV
jgi:steroid delta-isomerase